MHKLAAILILVIASLSLRAQEAKTIHVMVALCDNTYQGIVKVPKGIGNGQDPNTNLYWGCGYGVRTYFKKSAQWKEVSRTKVDSVRLERIVFKHATKNYYLVADAYNGKYIKDCTIDFLRACAGLDKTTITAGEAKVGIGGNAQAVAYIGHNGLMDFKLPQGYKNSDGQKRDAIILACASRQYFTPYIKLAEANPLLWTTHLMAPEAYVIHDALTAYINGEGEAAVRENAAAAYNKFQKCGINASRKLLVTGY